jgi:GDP-L-fucose synthase
MLSHINVGSGQEVSIGELAGLVAEAVGYTGKLVFDPTKPDGTPRKLMDSARLEGMGWKAATPLKSGLAGAYVEFVKRENA